METSFRSLPTFCQFMFSFSGRHTLFTLVDLWALYVFLSGNTYEPSSGLDLCILSSSPVVLSYLSSSIPLSNWDKQSWFPVRYFLSENVLCVDRVSQACL